MTQPFEQAVPLRPTRHRLAITSALSALAIIACVELIASLTQEPACHGTTCESSDLQLTVNIRKPPALRTDLPGAPGLPPGELPELTKAPADDRQRIAAKNNPSPSVPPAETQYRDWHEMAARSAKLNIDRYFHEQDELASRWQHSRSVMFQPDEGYDELTLTRSALTDLPFRAPVGVAGIGLTVGGCFFGLPLLGVPMDQRSTSGLTLVVCAPKSL